MNELLFPTGVAALPFVPLASQHGRPTRITTGAPFSEHGGVGERCINTTKSKPVKQIWAAHKRRDESLRERIQDESLPILPIAHGRNTCQRAKQDADVGISHGTPSQSFPRRPWEPCGCSCRPRVRLCTFLFCNSHVGLCLNCLNGRTPKIQN